MILIIPLVIVAIIFSARNARGNGLKRRAEWLAHNSPVGRSRAAIDASLRKTPDSIITADDGSYLAVYSAPKFATTLVFTSNDVCKGFSAVPGTTIDKTYNPMIGLPRKYAPDPTNPTGKVFHRRPKFDPHNYAQPTILPTADVASTIQQAIDADTRRKYKPLHKPTPKRPDL